ncbi:MAG: MFS transporter, partial [Thermoplasmataceae archaeon]
YRALCVAGMVLMALGFVPLMTISPDTQPYIFVGPLPVLGLVEGLIPIGFGIGFTLSATTISAQYSAEPRDIGASTSIVQFMGNIGGSVILSALTVFLYLKYESLNSMSTIGSVKLNQYGVNELAMSSAMHASFLVLLILSLVALISAFFIEGHLPVVLHKK